MSKNAGTGSGLLLPQPYVASDSGGSNITITSLTSSLEELPDKGEMEGSMDIPKKNARSRSEVKRHKSGNDHPSKVKADAQRSSSSSSYNFPSVVELNVGGTCFTTTLATLRKFPNSYLGKMFTIGEGIVRDGYGRYFIDRDPVLFAIFLNYLRTGNVSVPPGVSATQLIDESLYYNFEAFDLPVAMNVAEQFRNLNLKAVRSSFDKLWPILQKRMKMILENEPAFAAEIEWGPKQSTHNSLHKVEINYNGDWIVTRCFIKVEISWKEEETIRPCSCVETWAKYLTDFGFRTQVVSVSQLRIFW